MWTIQNNFTRQTNVFNKKINELLEEKNKKIKFYSFNKNENKIVIYLKGVSKLLIWIYDKFIELTLIQIDSLIFLLSYMANEKYINVSECAMILFGYISIYLNSYIKYYFYWLNKAKKSGSFLAYEWMIADYTINCSNHYKNKRKVLKLKKLAQKLSLNYYIW